MFSRKSPKKAAEHQASSTTSDASADPDLSHPDAMIRLASAVHRFRCPEINAETHISFVRSFKTTGTHHKTKNAMTKADETRNSLVQALKGAGSTVSNQTIVNASRNYLPFIHQVLLTCKVQPEVARLDERLVFEWASGIEMNKSFFRSEALMFEMVMTIACEAMGCAGLGCDECIGGDFAGACRHYKAAASIMQFLAEDQLPKWISRGTNVDDKNLPAEASIGTCDAFRTLFLAVGQQMVVASVLVKPGVPNYALLAKLCLGIVEHLELFVSTLRSKASLQQAKMDPTFFTLVTFQISLQRALSTYFLARSIWDKKLEFGLPIAMLKEAIASIQTRATPTGKGLPDIASKPTLKALSKDLTDLRAHMHSVLRSWEKDNGTVYFDAVPSVIPEDRRLLKGVMMVKTDPYQLAAVEPVPLSLYNAKTGLKRSDSDLARELQAKLNAGEDA